MRKLILLLLIVIVPNLAGATEANVRGRVIEVLVTKDSTYGGCMVKVSASVSGAGLNCPNNNYVSFSCSGDFHSKEEALRMFDLALMAKALNHNVNFRVTDTQKHNGFCTVVRVQS